MLSLLILIPLTGFLLYVLYRSIQIFRVAEGTVWERLLATSRDSFTFLWAKLLAFGGVILEWLGWAAQYLNMPELHTFLYQTLTPSHMAWAMIVISGITLLARWRSM